MSVFTFSLAHSLPTDHRSWAIINSPPNAPIYNSSHNLCRGRRIFWQSPVTGAGASVVFKAPGSEVPEGVYAVFVHLDRLQRRHSLNSARVRVPHSRSLDRGHHTASPSLMSPPWSAPWKEVFAFFVRRKRTRTRHGESGTRPDNRLLLTRYSRVPMAIVIPRLPCRDGPGVRDDGSDSTQGIGRRQCCLLPWSWAAVSRTYQHVCKNKVPHASGLTSATSGLARDWILVIRMCSNQFWRCWVLAVFLQMPMQP
ncbi:hypothetical protein CORC01_13184 [Colletotrichum orchidophilum]|uniref:Uncharacterized protein n=1 Tax=Colletotrichum orchidophilum TaxID=1209926 RepID=A0A1G4AR08_9PEZI|nr:uncharacterized protein CORC01_13184 [Colletotrichum orchidophilum]OHE91535.1 hypothetical protein CORC01_13184 [Colletotrichum orchidophilum]